MLPNLIEPGIKSYISYTLKQYQNFKYKYLSLIYNISLAIILISIVGLFLYYKYKGKINIKEKIIKENQKKDYIYSKLQEIKKIKYKQNKNLITDLPLWHE